MTPCSVKSCTKTGLYRYGAHVYCAQHRALAVREWRGFVARVIEPRASAYERHRIEFDYQDLQRRAFHRTALGSPHGRRG